MSTAPVGVLGGGQLGRMLALAGFPLGVRCRFLDPVPEAPVDGLGERLRADFDDADALRRFAGGLRLVTYEFENVPVASVRLLAELVPVYPPPQALQVAQDRLAEKDFLRCVGVPTPAYRQVQDRSSLSAALAALGFPAVLKARRLGYDGKGQAVIRTPDDAEPAWQALGGVPLILEAFVPFRREVSILGVRGLTGEIAFYPLVENHHREGILRLSRAPAPGLTEALQAQAERLAGAVLEALEYVGVLALELFQVGEGLLANELAPRVHNSGHWTIEGAETSQFENHLRAICGLPLGPAAARGHAAMLNLIGEVPAPERALRVPGAHLHLYDKAPRPGRKLGHVTLCCDGEPELAAGLERLRGLAGTWTPPAPRPTAH